MQEKIMKEPEVIEDGFRALEKERETDYGRIDTFGRDSERNHVILDSKRRRVGPDAVDQLQRHVDDYRERSMRTSRRLSFSRRVGLPDGRSSKAAW